MNNVYVINMFTLKMNSISFIMLYKIHKCTEFNFYEIHQNYQNL